MEDKISQIVEDLESALDKLGLYMNGYYIGFQRLDSNDELTDELIDESNYLEKAKSGDLKILINGSFRVSSDITWSDRVLNPVAHKEEQEFKKIVPTEFELELESFKSELDDWDI